jgi:hypothetical protein
LRWFYLKLLYNSVYILKAYTYYPFYSKKFAWWYFLENCSGIVLVYVYPKMFKSWTDVFRLISNCLEDLRLFMRFLVDFGLKD